VGGALTGLIVAAPFARLGGMRVVGLEYGVFVNNAATICPDQVTAQVGSTITLADGRSFRLDADPQWLAGELTRAENMVFVDTANGVVYGRFLRLYCGFSRPQRSQLITIPLRRKDLPSHGREVIAELDESARPSGGG
jgi:hypothetical protein